MLGMCARVLQVSVVAVCLTGMWATPALAQFKEPDVRVIHTFTGEASQDIFGWVTARLPDLDGDKIDDLIITAPNNDAGGNNAGRVYVYSSKTGDPIHVFTGKVAGGQFGNSVQAIGLIDDDNVPDIIIGAPSAGAGAAFIYSGKTGNLIRTLTGQNSGDRFGDVVRPIGGDFNDDGIEDLLIGAPNHDAAGNNAGRVYIISGKSGDIIKTLDGRASPHRFGSSAAPLGDINNDNVPDFIVGAPDAGGSRRGRAYVYSGADFKLLCTLRPEDSGRAMGDLFVSSPGDVNGDGKPNLYVTDWQDTLKGTNTGRVYVYSFVDGVCQRLHLLTAPKGNEGFGIGNGAAGDVNLDGKADLLVGSWVSSDGASLAGKVEVFNGPDAKLLRTITSTIAGEALGFDAHTMGDVSGDGYPDFLLSAAYNSANGFRAGRVYLVAGNPPSGDTNCDGSINLLDVAPFITALLNPAEYGKRYPNCSLSTADANHDGSVDLTDVAPFIKALLG